MDIENKLDYWRKRGVAAEQIAFTQFKVLQRIALEKTPVRRKWGVGVVRVCKECGAYGVTVNDIEHDAGCMVGRINVMNAEFLAFWNGHD